MISTGTGFRHRTQNNTWNKLQSIIKRLSIDVHLIDPRKTFGIYVASANIKHPIRKSSLGKGLSELDAKIGAVMELIERVSIIIFNNKKVIDCNAKDLDEKIILNNHVYCFKCENDINQCNHEFLNKCKKWVKVYNLNETKYNYVPFEHISNSIAISREMECLPFKLSTGIASGNSNNEAILHGLFEVIERFELYPIHEKEGLIIQFKDFIRPKIRFMDLYGLSEWKSLENYPIIDIKDIRDINTNNKFFENIKLYLISKNFYGLEVYTFLSEIKIKIKNNIIFIRGSGTHVDANISINRAISEMIQVLVGGTIQEYEILKLKAKQSKNIKLNVCANQNIFNTIKKIILVLTKLKMNPYIADLRNDTIEVPVVKVLIPELRYI